MFIVTAVHAICQENIDGSWTDDNWCSRSRKRPFN